MTDMRRAGFQFAPALLAGLAAGFTVPALGGGIWTALSAGCIVALLAGWFSARMQPVGDAEVPDGNMDTAPAPIGDQLPLLALYQAAILISPAWRILAANNPAEDMFGMHLVGTDLRQTVRHPVVTEAVEEAFAAEAPALRDISNTGRTRSDVRLRATPAGDGRLLLLFEDVSAARIAERTRVDFVANASHELRTPLANIMGFIETLEGPAADDREATKRFLGIMAREAQRMARLIDDLLSLSRIELDRFVRPQSSVRLQTLVTDVIRSLDSNLPEGREILVDLPDSLPPLIADGDQLVQVLHNLVSNALKYGRPGTPVRISAAVERARGGAVLKTVIADEGDGIEPEHLPRLTERFYRVDAGRSRVLGGTGLGLAIVKHIVERHRGWLEIESQPGQGTRVAFLLPVTNAATVTKL